MNTYIIRKYLKFALDHGGFDDEHNEQARRVLEGLERLTVEPESVNNFGVFKTTAHYPSQGALVCPNPRSETNCPCILCGTRLNNDGHCPTVGCGASWVSYEAKGSSGG